MIHVLNANRDTGTLETLNPIMFFLFLFFRPLPSDLRLGPKFSNLKVVVIDLEI